MMKNPKLSIIVPVYNVENYLSQCLDSLINQTLKEIEIICVNDGSTDNSQKVLEKYAKKDKRIKIIKKKNGGLSSARNAGMKEAKGEYIGFVDSDDWVDLSMYEKLYEKARKHAADMVICGCAVYYDNTKKFDQDNKYYNQSCFDSSFEEKAFVAKDTKKFILSIAVSACNKIYQRRYLGKVAAAFPIGLHFEDNPFFYRVFLNAGKIALLRENLYMRRWDREGSITQSANRGYFDLIKIFDLIDKEFAKAGLLNELKFELLNMEIASLLKRYSMVQKQYQKEFFLLIKEYFANMKLSEQELDSLNISNKMKYQIVGESKSSFDFKLRLMLNRAIKL